MRIRFRYSGGKFLASLVCGALVCGVAFAAAAGGPGQEAQYREQIAGTIEDAAGLRGAWLKSFLRLKGGGAEGDKPSVMVLTGKGCNSLPLFP